MQDSNIETGTRSPRRTAQLGLVVLAVVLVLAIWLPLGPRIGVWFLAVNAFGIFRLLQRCPACGHSLARRRFESLGSLLIYTPLPPEQCSECHRDL